MSSEPDWVREALSVPRFTPYLEKASKDSANAIQLYWWNVDVSAAFYLALHCLELALRNAVHRQLSLRYGQDDWWAVAPLHGGGPRMVSEAQKKLATRAREKPRPVTSDDMVAQLSLGFWVSLISRTYDRTLWVPALHRAFPFYRGPRGVVHGDLQTMLLFRNRIMHHEPIHHRHLQADHETLHRLVGYLSPGLLLELKSYDGVPAALARRPRRDDLGRMDTV
jgi:hypothetical protein